MIIIITSPYYHCHHHEHITATFVVSISVLITIMMQPLRRPLRAARGESVPKEPRQGATTPHVDQLRPSHSCPEPSEAEGRGNPCQRRNEWGRLADQRDAAAPSQSRTVAPRWAGATRRPTDGTAPRAANPREGPRSGGERGASRRSTGRRRSQRDGADPGNSRGAPRGDSTTDAPSGAADGAALTSS